MRRFCVQFMLLISTLLPLTVKAVDPSEYVTEISYNMRGCPTRIIYPDGTHEEVDETSMGDALSRSVRYTHDAEGRLTEMTTEWGSACSDYILDDLLFVAQEEFGPTLFMLAGLQDDGKSVDQGVVGDGEVSDRIRLTLITGVLNDQESVLDAARLISQTHGGENVHYIFHPTASWTSDIFYGVLTLVGYTPPSSRKLAERWRELIEEVGGIGSGGMILHYAHSLGGLETFRASQLMTEDELKMIRVITFGSAKVLTDERFHSVHNYVSWLDPVMIFDARYFNSADLLGTNLTFLTHSGISPIENHTFCGAVYGKVIRELGRRFVELYDPVQGYAAGM